MTRSRPGLKGLGGSDQQRYSHLLGVRGFCLSTVCTQAETLPSNDSREREILKQNYLSVVELIRYLRSNILLPVLPPYHVPYCPSTQVSVNRDGECMQSL